MLEEQPGCVEPLKGHYSEIKIPVCTVFCTIGSSVSYETFIGCCLQPVFQCICVLKQKRLEEGGPRRNGWKKRLVARAALHELPRQ